MSSDTTPPTAAAPALECFREYLLLMARMRLGTQGQGKIDASDVVQRALMEAHRHMPMFRGTTEAEMAAWLREILRASVADAVRNLHRASRDVTREISIDDNWDASSARLDAWLAAEQSSPSRHMHQEERVLRLAEGLATLPTTEREALVLRHCEGWTLEDISARLNVSIPAVFKMLKRGAEKLRLRLKETEQ